MIAFMPEPHILLIVVVGTEVGIPAPSAAWRAGAWPRLAGSTQPMITSCTSLGCMPESLSAAPIATLPSSVALHGTECAEKRTNRRAAGGKNDYG